MPSMPSMFSVSTIKEHWFSNIRGDVLAGIVVALALIPESLAFSSIANVDPKVALYASFSMAVVIAFSGGRPAMISAATGAMALLMVTLVKTEGLEYLLAATVLCGVLQMIAGWLNLGNLMRFVSRSVVSGFVNALGILIFMAQLPELMGGTWEVYAMTAAGLAIIYLLPLVPTVGKIVPSPLICIISMTALAVIYNIDIRTVGDIGALPSSLPMFLWPDVPLNWNTLVIIFPYSFSLAIVGLLESMMAATIVDDMTETTSDKNRECKGQGLANVVSGLLGGMAGCAMVGQSVINVRSGGRGRLSTLTAGVVLLLLVVFLGPFVQRIPMAALVAVMIMVAIGTFSWTSVTQIRSIPMSSTFVMVATVATVLYTHNLAYGVLVGVLLSGLFFANKISQILYVDSHALENGTHEFKVVGQVFFASADRFAASFGLPSVPKNIRIDVSRAHLWDITAVGALDKVIIAFQKAGAKVEVIGMNEASATMVDRIAEHTDADAIEKLMM